jgi:magnesium-transporting ATPase (P-type)
VDVLIQRIGVNPETGLTPEQVLTLRAELGTNVMPKSPKTSLLVLYYRALTDTTLLILIAAACVSFGIGYWEDPETGWIEGAAIFIAVGLVSSISAGNDYSKELQFRALEVASAQDEKVH